jgi:U3 small nucleolar RNA-associated protein 10
MDYISFCHNLCNEFDPSDVVTSLELILEATVLASSFASEPQKREYSSRTLMTQFYTEKTLNSVNQSLLRYSVCEFVADHIASSTFLDQLLYANTIAAQQIIQTSFLQMFQLTLQHLQHASEQSAPKKNNSSTSKLWKSMVKLGYSLLDNLNELLSLPGFVVAISKLLQHSDPQIRKRALFLFNEKIENEREALTEKQTELFLNMVESIAGILQKKESTEELDVNKQSALLSLEILARNFAKENSAKFLEVIPHIIQALQHSNSQVAASASICVATLSMEIGAEIIPHLSKILPVFLRTVQGSFSLQENEATKNRTLLQLSTMSSLEVIISSLAKFLSPYLADIVNALTHQNLVLSTNENIITKIKSLFTALASNVEPRLLLSTIFTVYKRVSEMKNTKVFISLYSVHLRNLSLY